MKVIYELYNEGRETVLGQYAAIAQSAKRVSDDDQKYPQPLGEIDPVYPISYYESFPLLPVGADARQRSAWGICDIRRLTTPG